MHGVHGQVVALDMFGDVMVMPMHNILLSIQDELQAIDVRIHRHDPFPRSVKLSARISDADNSVSRDWAYDSSMSSLLRSDPTNSEPGKPDLTKPDDSMNFVFSWAAKPLAPLNISSAPDETGSVQLSDYYLQNPSVSVREVENAYYCPGCPQTFRRGGDLRRHVEAAHDMVDKTYRCQVPGCSLSTKTWQGLDDFKVHVTSTHGLQYANRVYEMWVAYNLKREKSPTQPTDIKPRNDSIRSLSKRKHNDTMIEDEDQIIRFGPFNIPGASMAQ